MSRSTRVLVPFRFAVPCALCFGFLLCGPPAAASGIRVVASIKPVHSLVSAVMAGIGEPHLVIRGASSPHDFSLHPSDAATLEEAEVVFMVHERLEASFAESLDALAGDALVFELAHARGLIRRPFREGGRSRTTNTISTTKQVVTGMTRTSADTKTKSVAARTRRRTVTATTRTKSTGTRSSTRTSGSIRSMPGQWRA